MEKRISVRTSMPSILIGSIIALAGSMNSQQRGIDLGVSDQLMSALRNWHGIEMEAIRKIGHEEQVRFILLDILNPQTGNFWGRSWRKEEDLERAMFVLGEWRERRAIPMLREILPNAKGATKTTAVQALGKIDADGAKDLLYPMLLSLGPRDWAMQFTLVTALSQSKDRELMAKLEQYIRGEPDPKKRRVLEPKIEEMRRATAARR